MDTADKQPSAYLRYLPAIYQEHEFLGRFLHIFQDLMEDEDTLLDNLAAYLDPFCTPVDMLPWLAGLIDLILDENWEIEKRRLLVRNAAWLYRWRGTRRGLLAFLYTFLGKSVTIEILEDQHRPFFFLVRVRADYPEEEKIKGQIQSIINSAKPAHTDYRLEIIPTGSALKSGRMMGEQ